MKKCRYCSVELLANNWYTSNEKNRIYICISCAIKESTKRSNKNPNKKENDRCYRENHREELTTKKKKYVEDNLEIVKERQQRWYLLNRREILDTAKEYRESHKNERNKNERARRKNDPIYRLRTNVSKLINQQIRKFSSSKNGSIMQYMPFTIEQLKEHLESRFESWMNWNNYGRYNSKIWDDNDSSTWTWQIDHVIPQCDLPYLSMVDHNFVMCWELSNLRPLSAKQNILNGVKLNKRGRQ